MVRWLGRRAWVPGRYWYALELLRDYADDDPDGFHRFLWSNHLAYAETYEVDRRFGAERINETRHELFRDLRALLEKRGVDPDVDVRSVFEVGCSMGYLLRHMETDVFPSADVLEGIDIDEHAIRSGSRFLRSLDSKVQVRRADMSEVGDAFAGRTFDVIFCAGVLMYLKPEGARQVVRSMIRHTGRVLALAGLAYPDRDNREMDASQVRSRDSTWIHNLDRMVVDAGGEVIGRRWEGGRIVDGNTIYFVFAANPATGREAPA